MSADAATLERAEDAADAHGFDVDRREDGWYVLTPAGQVGPYPTREQAIMAATA